MRYWILAAPLVLTGCFQGTTFTFTAPDRPVAVGGTVQANLGKIVDTVNDRTLGPARDRRAVPVEDAWIDDTSIFVIEKIEITRVTVRAVSPGTTTLWVNASELDEPLSVTLTARQADDIRLLEQISYGTFQGDTTYLPFDFGLADTQPALIPSGLRGLRAEVYAEGVLLTADDDLWKGTELGYSGNGRDFSVLPSTTAIGLLESGFLDGWQRRFQTFEVDEVSGIEIEPIERSGDRVHFRMPLQVTGRTVRAGSAPEGFELFARTVDPDVCRVAGRRQDELATDHNTLTVVATSSLAASCPMDIFIPAIHTATVTMDLPLIWDE